jgi:membrane protein implicated in regulation of membrane protease activity
MTDQNKLSKKGESARTLLWLSGVLILIGMVVISPAAGLFCFALAALSAGGAIVLAPGALRVFSIMVAIGALIMVFTTYPAYKTHMDRYRESINN